MHNNKSNAPQERLEAAQAVPEAPASFADFTFQLETGDEGTFFNFEEAADVADVNELFRDDELCFNFEGFEETPATKSNSLSDHVMHWEKKDGAEFMRRQQIRWIDDEASASAAASASASAAASAAAIETLAVSMSASLPQNESASYEDK